MLALLLVAEKILAQQGSNIPTFYATFRSYASGGKELPFWFRANQDGAFPVGNNTTQLLRTGFYRNMEAGAFNDWDYFVGADLVAGYAGELYFQPNQYWGGARYRWLVIKAGAKADSIRFGGLSSTNGNLFNANNARPVPNISLSTNGYVPFPFISSWLSWSALYAEGFLWDNGYIQNSRLHHKNLYFKAVLPQKWSFSAGIEHGIFWGGISPTKGKISAAGEYLYFVSGIRIASPSTAAGEANLPENHLGIYHVEASKQWRNNGITIYWNHPFENRAGLAMKNAGDGLWGIHWKTRENQSYLTEVVYEWMNTLDQDYDAQSGSEAGSDDYYNDLVYRSGYTHFAQMMGSPLFVPTLNADGVSTGFSNNRIRMHHLGMKGSLLKNLDWKSLFTYSSNYGTYAAAYPSPRSDFSFLTAFNYQLPRLPLQVSAAVAGDLGELYGNRVGVSLGMRWEPLQDTGRWRGNWIIRKRR